MFKLNIKFHFSTFFRLRRTVRWFKGLDLMWQDQSYWSDQPTDHGITANEMIHSINDHEVRDSIVNFNKYSNWQRLLRTVAYMFRFAGNVKARIQHKPPTYGVLKHPELSKAEHWIYRQAQLDEYGEEISLLIGFKESISNNKVSIPKDSPLYKLSPFLDDHKVLRMRGRTADCEFIDLTTAHPILLPKKHPITDLIVRSIHERYHHLNHETVVNEMRQKFRIPKLRNVCYKVRRDCQACKNARAQPQPPIMADLPPARVAAYLRPFSYAGIDYFGPMQVMVGRRVEKRWVKC